MYPEWHAAKGHHFPDQSYVEFQTRSLNPHQVIKESIENELSVVLNKGEELHKDWVDAANVKVLFPDLPYKIPDNQTLRTVKIGNFPAQPCGGTHVKSVNELRMLKIDQVDTKGRKLKVKYSL
jgi:Ser-tRNA(Ala) deacylase AlaX